MRPLSPLVLPAVLAIAAPAERSPEQKQFDFWLGHWEVHDAKGLRLGHNTILALLGGTVLQEHWEGAKGGAGTSLNAYVPGQKTWRQHWVDASGSVLDLEGGLKGGSMILLGVQEGPRGRTLERICWTPLPDGRVRQLWDQSLDGGATWLVSFDGYYSRVQPGAPRLP